MQLYNVYSTDQGLIKESLTEEELKSFFINEDVEELSHFHVVNTKNVVSVSAEVSISINF